MSLKASLERFGRKDLWADIGLLIARVGLSGAVIWRHGYPKIFRLFENPNQFFDPIGIGAMPSLLLATMAEVIFAAALALGIYGRTAALVLTLNFVVIVVFLHGLQVPGDRGELALLYLIGFGALALTGPGRFKLGRR